MTLFAFNYMYRDGANYKDGGQLLLEAPEDTDLEAAENELRSYMYGGEFFIAHQVEVPEVASWMEGAGFDAEFDHCWHTFCELRPHSGYQTPGPHATIEEFLNRFRQASASGWEEFDCTKRATGGLALSDDEARLLLDALDSHAYWQIAGEDSNALNARNNGKVIDDQLADGECVASLKKVRELQTKLQAFIKG